MSKPVTIGRRRAQAIKKAEADAGALERARVRAEKSAAEAREVSGQLHYFLRAKAAVARAMDDIRPYSDITNVRVCAEKLGATFQLLEELTR